MPSAQRSASPLTCRSLHCRIVLIEDQGAAQARRSRCGRSRRLRQVALVVHTLIFVPGCGTYRTDTVAAVTRSCPITRAGPEPHDQRHMPGSGAAARPDGDHGRVLRRWRGVVPWPAAPPSARGRPGRRTRPGLRIVRTAAAHHDVGRSPTGCRWRGATIRPARLRPCGSESHRPPRNRARPAGSTRCEMSDASGGGSTTPGRPGEQGAVMWWLRLAPRLPSPPGAPHDGTWPRSRSFFRWGAAS